MNRASRWPVSLCWLRAVQTTNSSAGVWIKAGWIPSARIPIIPANCPNSSSDQAAYKPCKPLLPCLQHSDPYRTDLCLSSCTMSPVPRWYGLEGSTQGRHFTLDHTPTVQRKPWQVVWSTSSFPPRDNSRSGPLKEQWQSEGKCGFTPVVRCLLCNNEGQTSHPCWSKELQCEVCPTVNTPRRDLHDTSIPKLQIPHLWSLTHTFFWKKIHFAELSWPRTSWWFCF